jgi:hypothetical protein
MTCWRRSIVADAGVPVSALVEPVRELRDRVRAVRRDMEVTGRELAALSRQTERLAAMAQRPADLTARLDRLSDAFEPAVVADHVRAAVGRAAIVPAPVAHAVITDVLPAAAYAALLDAIPPPVFFHDSGTRRLELPAPPTLAPLECVVAWRFMTELASEVLGPAVVERFGPLAGQGADIRLSASQGRLLLRLPGFESGPRRRNPFHALLVVLCLAPGGTPRDWGSRVHGPDAADAATIPFVANTALAVVDRTGAHEYVPVPETAPQEMTRCTYEFPIGPDRESRRRLMV